jgi:integrase
VDFEQEVIVLPEHKTRRTQRKPKPRMIPMHPVVVKLLRSIQKRREGQFVFQTHRLTPWTKNTLAQRVMRARRKAGIPDDAKLYGVRHAFGTRGVVNGCDIKTLAELMGHTTTRMTEHYLHLAGQREHLASAMLLVNDRRRDA